MYKLKTKSSIVFIFLFSLCYSLLAYELQSKFRGPEPNSLYLRLGSLYSNFEPDTSVHYLGFAYSSDNWETYEVKKISLGLHVDAIPDSMEFTLSLPFGFMLPDKTPGVVYMATTNGLHRFWISRDYGKTWEFKNNDQATNYFGGIVEGEIYRVVGKTLERSIDYGNTYTSIGSVYLENEPWPKILDNGPGGMYWIKFSGDGEYPHEIYYSSNYNFSELSLKHVVKDTFTIAYGDTMYAYGSPELYRGWEPGEVYMEQKFCNGYNGYIYTKIFRSTDYCESFTKIYEFFHNCTSPFIYRLLLGANPGDFFLYDANYYEYNTYEGSGMNYIKYTENYFQSFETIKHIYYDESVVDSLNIKR